MSILRRLRGGASGSGNGPRDAATQALWAVNPEWVQGVTPTEFERICQIVAAELGPVRIPSAAFLRDFGNAAELSLPRIIPVLARSKRAAWPKLLHEVLEAGRANREAGERIEAASQTFAAARESLRIHWMPALMAPEGDVVVPGLLPDTVDGVALDAGSSVRHLSQRLFGGWGVSVEEVVNAAHERVLSLPLERWDYAKALSPELRAISVAKEGPYIGPIVRDLGLVAPDAVGPFGTVVGVPVDSVLAYRALDDAPGLRRDLALMVLVGGRARSAPGVGVHAFLEVPLWRHPDGTAELVTFKFAGETEATLTVIGSHSPAFEGVLTALDPLELLPVPGWAQGVLHRSAYTRFAGCVAAVRRVQPVEVALLGSAYSLADLVAKCRGLAFDEWPALIAAHLTEVTSHISAATGVIDAATLEPDSLRGNLVTWLVDTAAAPSDAATRPFPSPGLVEVLGVMVDGFAIPVPAATAALAGYPDELFRAGRERVRAGLSVDGGAGLSMLSGTARFVRGQPSPLSAVPELLGWLPDLCGPYGALVGAGAADRLVVLPVSDASVVLDLPKVLALAAGSTEGATWAITPRAFWVSPDRLDALEVHIEDGIVVAITSRPNLPSLVARLPEPKQVPPGLAELLGPDRARRLYAQLRAAVLDLLHSDPLAVAVEFTPIVVREIAAACQDLPPDQWPDALRRELRERAAPRAALDRLSLGDYSAAASALALKVGTAGHAGSQLARDVKGGLVAFPCLQEGARWRRVNLAMLDRWGVSADQVYADALARTAAHPTLVDLPVYADGPAFVRKIHSDAQEMEAVGLALHIRYPGSRRGFVVSITHGSVAYYVRLDDHGAAAAIPVFASEIRKTYARAEAAADALSPWLVWLTPDGRLVELFDVRKPLPGPEGLPPEFVAMLHDGGSARPN